MVNLSDCLTDAELDDVLSRPPGADAERHLSVCASCRGRLVARHEGPEPEPRPIPSSLVASAKKIGRRAGSRTTFWAAALAASLVVAFAGLYVWRAPNSTGDAVRDVSRDVPMTLVAPELLDPPEGARVSLSALAFRWDALPGVLRYDIRIIDGRADVIVERSVTTSSATLPDARDALRAGQQYYWFVRARWPDGRLVESEIRSFVAE